MPRCAVGGSHGFRARYIRTAPVQVKSLERYVSSSARDFEKEKEAISQARRNLSGPPGPHPLTARRARAPFPSLSPSPHLHMACTLLAGCAGRSEEAWRDGARFGRFETGGTFRPCRTNPERQFFALTSARPHVRSW